MIDLKGLLVVLTTPFKAGDLDKDAFNLHIKMLEQYATGFVIGGTTGESGSLTDQEMYTLLQEARRTVPDKKLIAGFWRPTIQATMNCAKQLAAHADALLVPIPQELFHSPDIEIEKFFTELADNINSYIILYNFPARCENRAISIELAKKLAANNKRIIGVKDSSETAQLVLDIVQQKVALLPMLGNDRFLYQILNMLKNQSNQNRHFASISGASSYPKIAAIESQIYQLIEKGYYPAAEQLQNKLNNEFFDDWSRIAQQLGGQSPIIKFLIHMQEAEYPIAVREPLLAISEEISHQIKQ